MKRKLLYTLATLSLTFSLSADDFFGNVGVEDPALIFNSKEVGLSANAINAASASCSFESSEFTFQLAGNVAVAAGEGSRSGLENFKQKVIATNDRGQAYEITVDYGSALSANARRGKAVTSSLAVHFSSNEQEQNCTQAGYASQDLSMISKKATLQIAKLQAKEEAAEDAESLEIIEDVNDQEEEVVEVLFDE